MRRSAEAVADKFCRSLGAAVAGSVAAETTIYGERLADERVSGGAFLAPVETLVEEDEDVEEDSGERVLRGGFFPTTTGRRTPGVRAARHVSGHCCPAWCDHTPVPHGDCMNRKWRP